MILKNNHGKGDRKGQRKRRKERMKHSVPKTKEMYYCIDGNMTNHPVAYCTYHHGVLTEGLMCVHRCKERKCVRLREGDTFD